MIRDYEIKINKPLRGYIVGSKVRIKADEDGTPLDRYWRDRFRDAKRDNCIEVVRMKKKKKGE